MGLEAQMFRIYTEWLMTQVRYLKRSIHWQHSIVNEVPQLVCMQRMPPCIWKVCLDPLIADIPLLLCPMPYMAPALVHNYSCINFCTILPPFYLCFVHEAVTFRCRWPQHSLFISNWKWKYNNDTISKLLHNFRTNCLSKASKLPKSYKPPSALFLQDLSMPRPNFSPISTKIKKLLSFKHWYLTLDLQLISGLRSQFAYMFYWDMYAHN